MQYINEIKDQQVRLLYQQSPFLLLSIVGLVLIVYWFFQERVTDNSLIIWTAAVLVLSLLRILLIYRFKQRKTDYNLKPWALAFTLTSLLSGISWGVIPLTILDPEQKDALVLVSILLTGMCTGGLVPLSVFIPAFLGFSTTTILPLVYVLYLQPESSASLLSFMLILYLISLNGFSLAIHKNIIDTIRLRFENKELIEEAQQQKQRAEKESEDKSRFIAATSHDLRQPLHALNLYLDALRLKLSDDKAVQLLYKAQNSSQAVSDLLNALMDMSSLDAGMVSVNNTIHNIEDIINPLLIELKPQLANKNISLNSNVHTTLVNTDSVLLTRILRNLIVNALVHNRECEISVSTETTDKYVFINIRDTGKGIAQEELENIFSEFYQLNNPERDRNKGLGLGLAIVKRLVHLLNIDLSVESQLNQGTRFTLRLPLSHQDVEIIPENKSSEINVSGTFVMLVDDNETVCDALKILLRTWDCEVLTALSELALLKEIKENNYPAPDVLISDYRLRDSKNGVQVINAVRAYYQQVIPAIIITGDTSTELELKNCQVLYKPIQSQVLKHAIEQSK